MKEKLALIGVLILIAGACYGVFTYWDKNFARCEDVKKVDQKVEKTDQKVDKTLQIMDYKFKALQLETKEDRIYKIEEKAGKVPKDQIVAETLEKLKREREQILREMDKMEKEK